MSGELGPMGVRKPLDERLPSLLEPGEPVSFIGICTPAGNWLKEMRDGHVFVATDRRLLLMDVKFVSAKDLMEEALAGAPKSIRFRDIRGLNERLGLFESKLDIELEDETIKLTSMRRKGAKAAAEAIRRHAPLRPVTL
jgi:hypothetical protein